VAPPVACPSPPPAFAPPAIGGWCTIAHPASTRGGRPRPPRRRRFESRLRSGAYRVLTRKRVFLVKKLRNPLRKALRKNVDLWKNCRGTACERGRISWWLRFHGVTHTLVQSKSRAVKNDTEPIAMTATGLHDPIINQYRQRYRMCGCCWPAAPAC